MSISESTIQKTSIVEHLPSVAIPQQFSGLQTAMQSVTNEASKYGSKRSKVQATRLRKSLMALSKRCKDERKCVLEESKKVKPIPRLSKTSTKVDDQRKNEHAENQLEKKVAKKSKKGKK